MLNFLRLVPDIKIWAASVQAAVTAIRKEGATSQYILLPGNDYTSAGSFVTSGSAAALSTVTNLDGSTTNLIFDVHKYFDSDNSGTHINCVDNHINDSFSPLATYLRQNQRMAVLSEAGGGSENPSCITRTFLVQSSSCHPHKNLHLGFRCLFGARISKSELGCLPRLCRLGCWFV